MVSEPQEALSDTPLHTQTDFYFVMAPRNAISGET